MWTEWMTDIAYNAHRKILTRNLIRIVFDLNILPGRRSDGLHDGIYDGIGAEFSTGDRYWKFNAFFAVTICSSEE